MNDETDTLLHSARGGCEDARQQLLMMHRKRLKRMVSMRLHPLLRSRVDESDIVQEALLDAWPDDVKALSGAWQDFPSLEEIRQTDGLDVTQYT